MTLEIEQVLINLFKNSCQAIAEDPEQKQPIIHIRTRLEKENIVIEVQDNGPGMVPEIQAQVFNPFFTTKEVGTGTGLGLAVSRSIVCDKHGGNIEIESEPGQGCTVSVILPIRGSLAKTESS